jgi:ferredoxin-NADP reductase
VQKDWEGEKGYFNAHMLQKYVGGLTHAQYFICGPPVMMNNVIQALQHLGVSKTHIHYERFALI